MTSLCNYSELLGKPGIGLHTARIPGTNTAAADYLMTLLAAWGFSALVKTPLVPTTVILFLVGTLAHYLFCVRV